MALVFLESLLQTEEERKNWWIVEPEIVLQTNEAGSVIDILRQVEQLSSEGYFTAGFISYEAGYCFLPNLPATPPSDFPLVWFACSKHAHQINTGVLPDALQSSNKAVITDLRLNLNLQQYAKRINQIRRYIEAGETYQVNFTMRYFGDLNGSPRDLFRQLRKKQKVSYAAYIETDTWSILSFSPELFFRKEQNSVSMRPMKGTATRGKTSEEDEVNASELRNSPKERSENLMIVDLLRNDLGKICEPGSVTVERELDIEKYETVLQMTSTIVGRLPEGTKPTDVLSAVFPSGSVTGAPKIRTMQIIRELEELPRKIYTGSIGYITPCHSLTKSATAGTQDPLDQSVFSVAIRTVIIERATGRLEMGVGSGVLYEADPEREYRECELKAKFLTEPALEFQLIETMLWQPETGLARLNLHMERLLDSARYFLFSVSRKHVEEKLQDLLPQLQKANRPQRVRLLADREGAITVTTNTVENLREQVPFVCFSKTRTNSENLFLYHKTTNRLQYDSELVIARERGCFDVIFCNERGEVTEGAISNIVIQNGAQYFTPPVSAGLLPGTYRKYLLEAKVIPIEEKILYPEDLLRADHVYLTNSIREMIEIYITGYE